MMSLSINQCPHLKEEKYLLLITISFIYSNDVTYLIIEYLFCNKSSWEVEGTETEKFFGQGNSICEGQK